MQERRPTVEAKPRGARPARPRLILSWHVDPATGKPVAQWIVESETTESFELQAA